MEWHLILLLIFGSLVILMATGLPIAFCFLLICLGGMYVFFGLNGLEQLIVSISASLATFVLLPIPLFILMGEVMFHSGIAPILINSLDKWLGQLHGRLALLAVGAGTLFSTLTGTSLASVAMLGSVLVPEMERKGYKKTMILGPILGSGGLAMMIPPSGLAVLLAAIAEVSVGKVLIAIIVPGLLMATIYTVYIIGRCKLQPWLAPAYHVPPTTLHDRIMDTMKYVLPQGTVVFLVIGVIFLGVTTPSEAAATGALGTIILAFCYKRMNWEILRRAISGTIKVNGMIFLIIGGATAFSQILAYSGATAGLSEVATSLHVRPVFIIVAMQVVLVFLGCFMDPVCIMMVTVPMFFPVIESLGFNPVWFCVIMLVNLEMAVISPPFGLSLFVLKGLATPDTKIEDVYRASLPFMGLNVLAMALVIIFPELALWLPGQMR